jgi:hypothetical protein
MRAFSMELAKIQILALIREGHSYEQISKKLGLTVKGVLDSVGEIQGEYIEFLINNYHQIYQFDSAESDEIEAGYEENQEEIECEVDFDLDDFMDLITGAEPSEEDITDYISMANSENENGIENFTSGEDGQFNDDDDDDDDDEEWYLDYIDDNNGMPCDLDESECGVTCFNCPRGN